MGHNCQIGLIGLDFSQIGIVAEANRLAHSQTRFHNCLFGMVQMGGLLAGAQNTDTALSFPSFEDFFQCLFAWACHPITIRRINFFRADINFSLGVRRQRQNPIPAPTPHRDSREHSAEHQLCARQEAVIV